MKKEMKGTLVISVVISFILGLTAGYIVFSSAETADSIEFIAGENILYNSDFESEIESEPAYWYKAMIEADNLSLSWDDEEYYSGSRSVCISNTHEYEEVVCNNWAQTINQVPIDRIVEITGWIKTIDAESVVMVIQCWDENHNMVGFGSTQSTINITGTTDWQQYTASVRVPNDTQSIIVRLVLTGKGQVWFDDVTLVIK